jgi:hypothetical protein
MIKGVIGRVIGGVIGAAAWAAIAYYTGYEIGWIAWLVGALVGFLTGAMAGDDASPLTGAAAAVIALAAIAGGRYAVIHIYVTKMVNEVHSQYQMTDELAMSGIADQVVEEWEKSSKPVKWPEGMTKDEASEEADYPKDVWADAKGRWNAMTPDQRDTYKKDLEASHHAEIDGLVSTVEAEAFKRSISPISILFALFAVISAFKLGCGDLGGGGE